MLKPMFAFLALAAAPAATAAQSPAPALGQWKLASGSEGCMVHASSGKGTVLSISGMPGEETLLFVIQNHELASLSDGQQVPIEVEFDDFGEWQIEAMAQANLDSDGPGLIFAVRPGREDGASFLKEFVAASGMRIGPEASALDRVALTGGSSAMSALATCLSQKWASPPGPDSIGGPIEGEPEEAPEAEEPVPL